jgi:hypothetical protein
MPWLAIAAALFALTPSACAKVLEVTNTASLEEPQLADPTLEQFLINGVISEFQFAYTTYALWSGVLADEMFADHPNLSIRDFSLHTFDDGSSTDSLVYASLQRTRQAADDAVERLRKFESVTPASRLNVARALIYGGYAYVLLGEGFCDAPVNVSAPLSPAELLTRAVARFDEGIVVATAVRTEAAATSTAATAATAQDLLFLAYVGAARASIKKGDLVRARTYASLVTDPTYERWAYYSSNSVRENNAFQIGVRAALPFLGMQPAFQNLNDLRVPQPATPRSSLRSNPIFPPLRPSMFSGWSPTSRAPIEVSTHIRFASGLEARYIGVEADGPGAAMLTFVNARRAVGGKAPVDLTGQALLAEFRTQRALDFYLTGQRLGDLRRYAAAGVDLFPTGKYPTLPEAYGSMHCLIVPRSEKTGNPHY